MIELDLPTGIDPPGIDTLRWPTRTGVLDAIGNTPLVRFDRFLGRSDIRLFAKLEYANPGGSAKDRPARLMIEQALRRGDIHAGSTIIESSSGNMGIGLAQACRYHGLSFVCVVDPRAQSQNLEIIKALGGRIELVTLPLNGDFLAARIAKVCQLLEETPDSYWPNQYANPDNPRSHCEGTVREIDDALGDELDVLFVATSSTGTAQGCRDYLRQRGRHVEVVAVDSVGSVLFGGSSGPRMIPGLGAGKEPALAKGQAFDRVARVSDLDCVVGCRRLAQREAVLVGGSAGGVLLTVDRMKEQLAGKTCAAVLHDSGTRYLQTVFNDQWVAETLNCSSERLKQLVSPSVHQSPVEPVA
ncbi:2,3-diaminopropionate biosynthesis protein SbnA [Planctomycetes bacterium K23_9]|uniref:N-(2-amino-2-carboxyethyl)-L-glutamate synthase n=1 Tax=Stieleria marina TaxID=1930275 RepID=A0A517NXR7_9BACT|nr:putative siderophore biosynthesis protein SbnA [Planctomycetes bacterium K23_9]